MRLKASDDGTRRDALPAAARAAQDRRPMLHAGQTPSFLTRLFGREAPRPVTRWYAAHVPQGTTRELAFGSGRITVHCRDGEAWITHDGDPRDVVLQAKQSYAVDRGERMTVHALKGNCVFEIEEEL